jgi:hypothetical protein
MEEVKSAIDLREAARVTLKDWMMEQDRDQIIPALGGINGVAYTSATAAQRNAWLVCRLGRNHSSQCIAS